MLDFLRRRRKSILGVLIAAFCVLLMAGFGLQDYLSGPMINKEVALKIDSTEISFGRYRHELERLASAYRRQLGQSFDTFRSMLNLEQRTIDQLIAEELFTRFVDDFGFGAGARQIEEKVLEDGQAFFQGRFDREMYNAYLRALGVNEAGLEHALRREIAQQQLTRLFSSVAAPAEAQIRRRWEREQERAKFVALKISANDFAAQVVADDTRLRAYFEENKEKYREPKAVSFAFVEFTPQEFGERVALSEEDLQAAYEEQKFQFVEPAKLHLRQIVFLKDESSAAERIIRFNSSSSSSSEQSTISKNEQAKQKAEAVLERLKNGENFQQVATEVSEDKASAKNGGERGWTASDDISDAKLREAAESLELGEHSTVIEAADGFYILFLDDMKEARQKDFAEVREALLKSIREADAPLYMSAAAEKFYEEWQSSDKGLKDFAAAQGRTARTTPGAVSAGMVVEGVMPELIERALPFQQGDRQLFSFENAIVVAEILEVRESQIPEFTKVIERAKKDYTDQEARVLARQFAQERLQDAQGGAKLTSLAEKFKLRTDSSEFVTRASSGTLDYLRSPDHRNTAFALSAGAFLPTVVESDRTFYLVELAEKKAPDAEAFANEKTKFTESESTEAGERMFAALSEALKARAEITTNPELLQKAD